MIWYQQRTAHGLYDLNGFVSEPAADRTPCEIEVACFKHVIQIVCKCLWFVTSIMVANFNPLH